MTPEDDARARHLAGLDPGVFRAGLDRLDADGRRRALVLRFRYDRAGFLRFCFPDVYDRPFNPYHLAVLAREKTPWRDRRNTGRKTLRADAAPRGAAKTAITKGDLVHDVVYGLERVVPYLSAESSHSERTLGDMMAMLGADRIRALYGDVRVTGGVRAFRAVTPGGASCAFFAKSFGTSVRGLNDGSARPTKVVVDDGENRLRVDNPDVRREWWDFLQSDVLKLGDQGGGLIVEWRGTVLHTDSVLARLLKSPGWSTELYKACVEWPRRRDLWDACGQVWGDLRIGDLDERRAAALAFYDAHRAEMDEGAVMLDPVALPLFAFYEAIWSEGLGSVLKELQNTPRDPSTQIFTADTFPKCRVVTLPNGELGVQRLDARGQPEGRVIRRSEARMVTLRLDPIPGEDMGGLAGGPGGSDYAAIAVLLTDAAGVVYVVDGWLDRVTDSRQMAMFWTLAEKWQAERAKIESNGFQRWMLGDFKRLQAERKARAERGERVWWQTALADAGDSRSTTNKVEDIAALEPVIATRRIFFADTLPGVGMAQFDEFPTGTHDDFPDAVARGYRDARGGVVQMGSFSR